MGEKLIQAGNAVSAFTGVTLLVLAGYRFRFGAWGIEEVIALGFLAVAVVASYRAVAVRSGPRVNAVGTVALFAAAVAAYGGGVNFGVDPAMTVGQALFAIAVAYFLIQRF